MIRDGREGHGAVGGVGNRRGLGHRRALGCDELELKLALGQAATVKDLGSREGLSGYGLCLVVVRKRGVHGLLQRCRDLAVMGVDKLKGVGGDVLGVRVAAGVARNLARGVGNGLCASAVLVWRNAIEVVLRVP